ncbi:MAG: exopolygalacturonase, partial [Bacteroidales bacterium]|nr:exopolygalacturonase [Bacteroidales bacterium]
KDRKDIPISYGQHVTMRNIDLECQHFFNVKSSDQYVLSDFTFENIKVKATANGDIDKSLIENFVINNVSINQ